VSSSRQSDIFVVFKQENGHWLSRFLHPTIQHCLVIKPSLGKYIVYEKTKGKLRVYNVESINDIIGPTDITVGYMQKEASNSLFMLNTCVGHTKKMLGIDKPFVWTPYQLFKLIQHKRR
jgi:hypothetical protein